MDADEVRKHAAKKEAKELVPTSFGPSEDEDIILKRQIIARNQKTSQNQDLSAQIEAKKQMHKLGKDSKIEMERHEMNENSAFLQALTEK